MNLENKSYYCSYFVPIEPTLLIFQKLNIDALLSIDRQCSACEKLTMYDQMVKK
jgi:hypothetical protein